MYKTVKNIKKRTCVRNIFFKKWASFNFTESRIEDYADESVVLSTPYGDITVEVSAGTNSIFFNTWFFSAILFLRELWAWVKSIKWSHWCFKSKKSFSKTRDNKVELKIKEQIFFQSSPWEAILNGFNLASNMPNTALVIRC